MIWLKSIAIVLLLHLLLLIGYGCSSSSTSQRYNQTKEEEEESASESVRFTSKDDAAKAKDSKLTLNNYTEDNEFDEEPYDDFTIDTKGFIAKYDKLKELNHALTDREKILFELIKYFDTPYQYGGNSKHGIDCSAFTQTVFQKAIQLSLPRTALEQFHKGRKIARVKDLKFGDLIFFDTVKRSKPGHVGIFIGENLFAHASRTQGVTISSLKSSYYNKRFFGARRITDLHSSK